MFLGPFPKNLYRYQRSVPFFLAKIVVHFFGTLAFCPGFLDLSLTIFKKESSGGSTSGSDWDFSLLSLHSIRSQVLDVLRFDPGNSNSGFDLKL